MFRFFDYIDKALISEESRGDRAVRVPAVWPSSASAEPFDKSAGPIIGKCHRASFLSMIGTPVTNQTDAKGALRFRTGRAIEDDLTFLSTITQPRLHVANGVRHYNPETLLSFEMDLIVIDPDTKQGCIVEDKTYYGYDAKKQIVKMGEPKIENLMQVVIYLWEMKNGKKLKEVIEAGLKDKAEKDKKGIVHRNRIDVSREILDMMDDGPVFAKLAYIARDDCERREFDIGIEQDFDGSHYPTVDGVAWKTFTVESIYDRYKKLQGYWYKAESAAKGNLGNRGISKPEVPANDALDPARLKYIDEEKAYFDKLAEEMRNLPVSYWPPAEYEYQFNADKIERLRSIGRVGKTKYEKWKKKSKGYITPGDWQCNYCAYKRTCVPLQRPELTYLIQDITEAETIDEEE